MGKEFVSFPERNGTAEIDQQAKSGSTVRFTSIPNTVTAEQGVTFPFTLTVKKLNSEDRVTLFGDKDFPKVDVKITASLLVNGVDKSSIVDSTESIVEETSVVEGSLNHSFSNPGEDPGVATNSVIIRVDIEYEVEETDILNDFEEVAGTGRKSINVERNDESSVVEIFQQTQAERLTEKSVSEAYDERVPFKITDLELERDSSFAFTKTENNKIVPARNAETTEEDTLFAKDIQFGEFSNPSVAIDGAGRFAKHEIIGGATVRQKVGEDPLNISIDGVCDERTANRIDGLRNVKKATIISSRLPGSQREGGNSSGGASMTVQFGSTSTEPLGDGGVADLETGELLYSYSIEAIEVTE